MRDSDEKDLSAKQQRALVALLANSTIAEAAVACATNEATVYRYLQNDAFKSHLRRARSEVVAHAIGQLQRDCEVATRTLRAVCEDTEAPASARVSAAKAILDGAIKGVELQDIAARLEALEGAKGGAQSGA
jgi:hypothetical protein